MNCDFFIPVCWCFKVRDNLYFQLAELRGRRHSILTVDEAIYGSNYEAIERKIRDKNGVLEVTKSTIWIPYTDIPKYIKRFDFLAMTSIAESATSIEISE